jgi:imidazolonepropionase-like amidohydrolase
LSTIEEELVVHDLDGAWVTPGLVDLHSHIGVHSSPLARGEVHVYVSQAGIEIIRRYI